MSWKISRAVNMKYGQSKISLIFVLLCAAIFAAVILFLYFQRSGPLQSPGGPTKFLAKEKPYEKYTFENLAKREPVKSQIEIGRMIKEEEAYTSYMFYYRSEGRRISGQINLPNLSRLMKVVVMARGYVDKEQYQTGIGTKNAAAVYAANGYITLAPDFSGYGESDREDENAIGARLAKPVEILDLLASIATLPQADPGNVVLWGHSNGGQIMLSVAEIWGMKETAGSMLPVEIKGVTLWAPVSKPFPYSILYYTDEADDKGKWLRRQVADFELDYDVYLYSLDRYWDKIEIPILIHQGSADEAVIKKWSDELAKTLKEINKNAEYYVYPGADHNFRPKWDEVVARDMEWFNALQ